MRLCSIALAASLALSCAWAESSPHVATVVRPSMKTGRLVRTAIIVGNPVSSRAINPALIPAVEVKTLSSPIADALGVHSMVEEAARVHQVDPLLVHSVISVESNYNPIAVSPKGAQGLMQLIPSTARRFGVANPFDVRQNIEGGVRYLRYLQDMFQDDRLAIAAYNAGEGAVMKYGNVPPYQETEQYVDRVGRKYGAALKQRKQNVAKAPVVSAGHSEPAHLDTVTDEQGRVYLRTRN